MASAHSAITTLKFTAVTVKRVTFTKTNFGIQETDVNSRGKTIGFDDVNLHDHRLRARQRRTWRLTPRAVSSTAHSPPPTWGKTFSGKVTGGTGPYKGATGTITAKSISSTKTAVIIVYS